MQVSKYIFDEILVLASAFALGSIMMFIYDILRIFRRAVSHGVVWVSFEDIIYWMGFGLAEFLLLYYQNNGAIRGYILVGTAIGIFFYYLLLGRWLVKKLTPGIYRIKKSLKKYHGKVTIWLKKRFKN